MLESLSKAGGRDLVAGVYLESSPVTVGPDCASTCRGLDGFCSHYGCVLVTLESLFSNLLA